MLKRKREYMKDFKSYLKAFCMADGVSGFEEDGGCARLIIDEIKPYADHAYLDKVGNIIAFKKGKRSPEKRVLFAAHMDEVGFVIKSINEDGTLLFDDIGIHPSVMPCEAVRVGENRVNGVIGMTPVHLLSADDRKKAVRAGELYIDIGATSKEDAQKYVSLGDYVAFDECYTELSDTRIKVKAIDDRIGCAILCLLIKQELEFDTYFAFTTGEELGTRGAFAAASDVKPDIVIVAEATTAGDVYGNNGKDAVCRLDGGVVLPFADGGTVYNRELRFVALEIAQENNIKTQTKTKIAGGTDARTFQRSACASAVLGVALPCRYIHSASCVADVRDMLEMKRLIFKLADNLDRL